jgi:hypothetical protein
MAIINEVDQEKTRVSSIGGFIFWTDYETDPANPDKLREIDRVSWTKIGDPLKPRIVEAIARLKANPAKKRPAALEWATIEPAYNAWKAGQAIPENGTPLSAWPGCDRSLAEALKARGVLTVENFASLEDHRLGGLGIPDARRRQEMAKAFLTAQKGEAVVAAELAKRDKEIADLRAMIEQITAPPAVPAGAVPAAPPQRVAA